MFGLIFSNSDATLTLFYRRVLPQLTDLLHNNITLYKNKRDVIDSCFMFNKRVKFYGMTGGWVLGFYGGLGNTLVTQTYQNLAFLVSDPDNIENLYFKRYCIKKFGFVCSKRYSRISFKQNFLTELKCRFSKCLPGVILVVERNAQSASYLDRTLGHRWSWLRKINS